jgi:hypothetical protein
MSPLRWSLKYGGVVALRRRTALWERCKAVCVLSAEQRSKYRNEEAKQSARVSLGTRQCCSVPSSKHLPASTRPEPLLSHLQRLPFVPAHLAKLNLLCHLQVELSAVKTVQDVNLRLSLKRKSSVTKCTLNAQLTTTIRIPWRSSLKPNMSKQGYGTFSTAISMER